MDIAQAPAPSELEREVILGLDDAGGVSVRPGKRGVMHVRTPDGDFVVTNNGANRYVTTDEQGRVKEVTITSRDESPGGQRMTVRSFRAGPAKSTGGGMGGGAGGTERMRSGGGAGAAAGGFGAGAGGPGVAAPGAEVEVQEEVLAPPMPAKP